MGDHDKGLLLADDELPNVCHIYYIQHIAENSATSHARRLASHTFRHAAIAICIDKYSSAIEQLMNDHPQTATYIQSLQHMWVTPFIRTRCYGQHTSQLVEEFNAEIDDIRRVLIIAC